MNPTNGPQVRHGTSLRERLAFNRRRFRARATRASSDCCCPWRTIEATPARSERPRSTYHVGKRSHADEVHAIAQSNRCRCSLHRCSPGCRRAVLPKMQKGDATDPSRSLRRPGDPRRTKMCTINSSTRLNEPRARDSFSAATFPLR
ncbi:uncharacterized protein LOC116844610 [Odontomachus brunneus]|uniref:uncharacterized protein LOC116844610 n=1 Tax=Odontomachus brunneus TaxID=486640 RepID=UPI0013F246E7|nr:uncharacterized protein LOC116844610 [Odontomachus brunneus]